MTHWSYVEDAVDGDSGSNPFLSGNFAPVLSEDDLELKVEGELPEGLRGQLLRIGPNPQFPAPDHFWFHGDGMVHGFEIADGRARYRNRFVRTPKFKAEQQLGRALRHDDPELKDLNTGVANTNVVKHGGRFFALEEMNSPFELTSDLGSLGFTDFGGPVTAHPKVDPVTGDLVFFAYSVGGIASAFIDVGIIGADGALKRRERIEAPYSSMIHDCFITENYLILPVLPLSAELSRARAGGPLYAWDVGKPSKLAVVPRSGIAQGVRWFDVAPGYVFHTLNAFEADGCIKADTFLFDTAPLFPDPQGQIAPNAGAKLGRWEIDLARNSDQVSWRPLDERTGEFPRMDERYLGRAYRHGWFAGQVSTPGSVWFDSLKHVDLVSAKSTEWILPAGDAISEPVFVPGGPGEGEGWVLVVAYRGRENLSELLVLDALAIEDGPLASARLPRRVPFGFHGNWINSHG